VATFQAIAATGATPVACDIDPETCTIDVKKAEQLITPNTKAIVPVHYASGWGDLEGVYALAHKHGLRVIEDAAHSFGSTYQGKKVGASGDVICFSFDGIKNITCGEGGAVVTGDPVVANRIKDARLLGVMKDTEKRYARERSWEFDVEDQGWRYHMSDIMASIGRTQLRKLPEFGKRRAQLAKKYQAELGNIPGIRLLAINYDLTIPHIFPIRVLDGKRDALRKYLLENNSECGIHYKPNHLLSIFRDTTHDFSCAERIYEELLTLPLHPMVTDEEQQKIITLVQTFCSSKVG
jgi:dTDP-4-amino-4,6-dideoxygalactose transaminase